MFVIITCSIQYCDFTQRCTFPNLIFFIEIEILLKDLNWVQLAPLTTCIQFIQDHLIKIKRFEVYILGSRGSQVSIQTSD
jgi:hypothetical protein